MYRCVLCCAQSLHARVQLLVTPWTVANQAPLSTGFSRQEYWSGLPCAPAGDLPNPGFKLSYPVSPALLADSLPLNHWGIPYTHICVCVCICLNAYLCLCNPVDCSPPSSSVHGDTPGKNTRRSFHFLLHFLLPTLNPGIKTRFHALQADSLPSEPPGIYINND